MGLGWGIVGFGWVASEYMAPAILAAGDEIVSVCDPSPASIKRANAFGAFGYDASSELIADPRVEALYVATPNHLHRQPVEEAAKAGKAILCEKPMAHDLAAAQAMADACEHAGVLFATAFDQRHHPAHAAIRDAIHSGLIGRVTAIRIVYACWVGTGWSRCGSKTNWRGELEQAGGGALIDLAPHGLDLIEFLVDEPLETITAVTQRRVHRYGVEDGAMISGSTNSGVLASMHVAYNCPEALPRRRLEVVGDQAQITALNTMGQDAGGTVKLTDGTSGDAMPLPIADAETSPFVRQAKAFSRAYATGDHLDFSLRRDLHTMSLIHRAYEAAHADRRRSCL